MNAITNDVLNVMLSTWPMIVLSCTVVILLRIVYLKRNNEKFFLSKDLTSLFFIIYILCLFQIVTTQDVSGVHGINITLFKELTRYELGSRLFYRNIIGNILLFIPFGFFSSYYLKLDKKRIIILLTIIISFVIEFIQLQIGRAFDVDDIVLNLLGGLIGYYIYRIINRIFGNLHEDIKAILILLFLLAVIVLSTLVII